MRSNPNHRQRVRSRALEAPAAEASRAGLRLLCAVSLLIVAVLLALGPARAAAEGGLRHLEYAAEAESLDIFVVDDSRARINARRCDYCELLTLTVDAQTRILMDGVQVTVQDAERVRNDGATVLFDPETRRVTRILLWHRPRSIN